MSARAKMTMRALLQRDRNAGIADERDWQTLAEDVPCYVWAESTAEIDATGRTAIVADWRAMLPLRTDVTALDRIALLSDRAGREIATVPLEVRGDPLPRSDHIELALRSARL